MTLDALLELLVAFINEIGERALEGLHRPREVRRRDQRFPQLETDSGSIVWVLAQSDSSAQGRDPARLARGHLGKPELQQDVGALVHWRRLRDSPLQVCHGHLGRPTGASSTSASPKHSRHPVVAARLSGQEVQGDLVLGGSRLSQQVRGGPVLPGPLGRRELGVDGRTHHRMHEFDGPAQDLRAAQRIDQASRGVVVEPGKSCRGAEVGAISQDRHRPGERLGLRSQATQPSTNRAGNRLRRCFEHARGPGRLWRDPFGVQRGEELAEQQGVAAGRLEAGSGEGLIPVVRQGRLHQRFNGIGAEQRRADHASCRGADEVVEQFDLGTGLHRPRCNNHEDRQFCDPIHEVGEEAQRRSVGPVRVVHGEDERTRGREIDRQPVQAVDNRVGPSRAGGRLVEPDRIEQRRREPGGPLEQLCPLVGGHAAEPRLEQLTHHAEREVALELAGASLRGLEALLACLGDRLGEETALADPGRALDEGEAAFAGAGAREQLAEDRELAFALQQLVATGSRSRCPSPRSHKDKGISRGRPLLRRRSRLGDAAGHVTRQGHIPSHRHRCTCPRRRWPRDARAGKAPLGIRSRSGTLGGGQGRGPAGRGAAPPAGKPQGQA